MNVPVCWRSKSQRGVTLSSSEEESVAISEAVKKIKFIYDLLQGISIEIDHPIIVKIENIGAMFMRKMPHLVLTWIQVISSLHPSECGRWNHKNGIC